MNENKVILGNNEDNLLQIKNISDIVYMESFGKKTKTVCTEGKEFILKRSLSEVEEKLPSEKFFKIHKSFIINIDYLKGINVNAHKTVLLHDGIELNIAHRKYKDFMDFIKSKFIFWQ